MRNFKRVLSIVLAATVMLTFSFSMAFAASSPTAGKDQGTKTGYYQHYKNKTADLYQVKKSTKAKKIPNYFSKDGVSYKVVKIQAKAFTKAKGKLKKIYVSGKFLKTVDAKAFQGFTKKQLSKIKVKIKKDGKTSKQMKSLKKQFIKAGIPSKNIKFY